ncbi:MAG: hypothetical protein A2066_20255 [Bacteroidetes bacterium GWB2_41_8]|nr:MAG: hypothetical protein A2066_20255 [Bacteroidetes bacterium GWB2_41_8]
MKKLRFLIAGMFVFLFALATQAQPATGIEYFKGKWNVTAQGPNGDVKMVIAIDQKDGKAVGTINGTDGKELYKVVSIEVKGNSATVNFIGSQGSEVPFELTKKDDNHVTGSIMSVFDASGERVK